MPGEFDEWLMRPVMRGMCRYESLIDGSLSLVDIARMNDALTVAAENQYRADRVAQEEAERNARR